MPDKLLTTRDLEELLQLDRVTIYRMVKDGDLPALRVGGQWRFSREAIDAWLQGRRGETRVVSNAPELAVDLSSLELSDLVPLETLEQIQNQFALLLGVASFTTNLDGKPLALCSHCSRFCRLVHDTARGEADCEASWRQIAHSAQDGATIHVCHAGIQYASAPVIVSGQRVGMVTAGQFLAEEPDPAAFRERALITGARIGVDGEALAAAMDSIEIVTKERALQITGLLATIANALSRIGYQGYLVRRTLAQIAELSKRPEGFFREPFGSDVT